jgi:hypothetical protein
MEINDPEREALMNQLLENGKRQANSISGENTPTANLAIAATERFLELYGDELFPDADLHMSAPVSLIRGKVVDARARNLSAKYFFDVLNNSRLDEFLEEVAAEIREELRVCKETGNVMCPYVVLVNSGVNISPEKFEPYMKFKIRYGYLNDECVSVED